ncbi:MAG: CHRD domain-containing protein [Calditrichia bacterium]
MSGDNQPTPVATTGHGCATFTLSENGDALHYMLEVYNIDDVTASHIHVGEPGASGGVTAFCIPEHRLARLTACCPVVWD